jgi:uncharacterized membrane protein YeiH
MRVDPHVFLLPPFFDYGATFLWAVTGALMGARRGYDFIGIFILAMVSATGGGLLRDGLFLQDGPPVLVRSPVYLAIVLAGTVIVLLFGKRVERLKGFEGLVSLVDALGLGAYAVVGTNRAMTLGLSLPGSVLVGMVNAVGGAILRSVLVAREPHLFKPGTLEAAAALIGCGIFLLLLETGWLNETTAAWVTIAAVFVIRLLSVRYRVQTRALSDFATRISVEELRHPFDK